MIIYFFYVVCYQTFSYSVVKSIFLNENLLGGGMMLIQYQFHKSLLFFRLLFNQIQTVSETRNLKYDHLKDIIIYLY